MIEFERLPGNPTSPIKARRRRQFNWIQQIKRSARGAIRPERNPSPRKDAASRIDSVAKIGLTENAQPKLTIHTGNSLNRRSAAGVDTDAIIIKDHEIVARRCRISI